MDVPCRYRGYKQGSIQRCRNCWSCCLVRSYLPSKNDRPNESRIRSKRPSTSQIEGKLKVEGYGSPIKPPNNRERRSHGLLLARPKGLRNPSTGPLRRLAYKAFMSFIGHDKVLKGGGQGAVSNAVALLLGTEARHDGNKSMGHPTAFDQPSPRLGEGQLPYCLTVQLLWRS
jgi:hypothetical protein